MKFQRIGFIGLGLIGGSIARAIKYFYPEAHLLAYSRTTASLEEAKKAGVIDQIQTAVDDSFGSCDLIFLCAPVSANASYLALLKDRISDSCILTDVGSTKTDIHQQVRKLGLEAQFIGGHPMAGSEKTGFASSKRLLIENAYYILTPAEQVPRETAAQMEAFIASLKALPLVLPYAYHDYVTAVISHLPHLIAASLVNLVRDLDGPEEIMKKVAAGGFKDITRIASSSPEMWEQICLTNEENIGKALSAYIASLEAIQESLSGRNQPELHQLFQSSRDYRNSILDVSSGPIKKEYALYCDMVDEAGGIATLATILATNGISLKNIGIIHNREFEEAVLRVEFYEEDAYQRAVEILRKYRYTVYTR